MMNKVSLLFRDNTKIQLPSDSVIFPTIHCVATDEQIGIFVA